MDGSVDATFCVASRTPGTQAWARRMNAGRHIALQHICIITHRVLLVCTCLLERAAQVLDLLLGALNQADYHEVSISKDAGLRVIL